MSTTSLWDSQSNLLLLQLIYKYGDPYTEAVTSPTQKSSIFDKIAQQLTTHSLIRPSKRKYSGNVCEQHYIELLTQESLTRELSLPASGVASKKPSAAVAALAQRLYVKHFGILKSEIQTLETEFLTLQKEIEEIERGDWDEKFKAQLPVPEQTSPAVTGLEFGIVQESPKVDEGTPTSVGTKRARGGRRKRRGSVSVSATPMSTADGAEEEEGESEEPPAKRSRRGTEEVEAIVEGNDVVAEEETQIVEVEEEQPVEAEVEMAEPTDEVEQEIKEGEEEEQEEVEEEVEEEVDEEVEEEVEAVEEVEEGEEVEEEKVEDEVPEEIVEDIKEEEKPAEVDQGEVEEEMVEDVEPKVEEIPAEEPTEVQQPHEIIDLDNEDVTQETEEVAPPSTKLEVQATPSPTLSKREANPSRSPTATRRGESSEPESDADTTPSRPVKKPFNILISPLHASLSSLRSATLFSQPIREIDAPGYSNLILRPTDLKTLWKQVKDGSITESVVFHREVARMFANAIMYNSENSAVWEMTRDMAKEGLKLCEGYRRSENFGVTETGRSRKRK